MTKNLSALDSASSEWWRTAVIYQIYPRSFADSSGDGVGDLPGITSRLGALAELGIDAVWLSPFFRSPQKDAGYDVSDYRDVDPLFGTLADFDALLVEAHALGIRVIADLVPNHSSDQHRWFQEALKAAPGSPERDRYMFRDGKGPNGDTAPNNWESVFGGSMWTRVIEADGKPGQWYLHIFDTSQPDFNWHNEEVREEFRGVLRFWLDRGVDGFRVDVAHGMIKADGLPDYTPPKDAGSMGGATDPASAVANKVPDMKASGTGAAGAVPIPEPSLPPYWGQDGVHEIYRDWRKVLDEYQGERILAAEAWVDPLTRMARWVRPDEMHQAFNFPYLGTPWDAERLRSVIDESIEAFTAVGAPSTWVLSNHDVVRHATRLSLGEENLQGHGIGPKTKGLPNTEKALRRGRAATALMLSLPGSAYIYQGEELGLPEDIELPDSARQDPTWFRTNGERYGRDGCRVPIPWEANAPAYGFSSSGKSWLPQPARWEGLARDAQQGNAGSTLTMYQRLLHLRRVHLMASGTFEWLPGFPEQIVALRNGDVTVIANTGTEPITLPTGEILVSSAPLVGRVLPQDTTVWLLTQ